jgi:hypothetical protein
MPRKQVLKHFFSLIPSLYSHLPVPSRHSHSANYLEQTATNEPRPLPLLQKNLVPAVSEEVWAQVLTPFVMEPRALELLLLEEEVLGWVWMLHVRVQNGVPGD